MTTTSTGALPLQH